MATVQGASEQPPSRSPYRLDGEMPSAKAQDRAITQNSELAQADRLPWRTCARPKAGARTYAGRVVRKTYAHGAPGVRKPQGSPVKEWSIIGAGELPMGLNATDGSSGSRTQTGEG